LDYRQKEGLTVRHSRAGGNPGNLFYAWIPAFAGTMTGLSPARE
jgi:hypothetical protein